MAVLLLFASLGPVAAADGEKAQDKIAIKCPGKDCPGGVPAPPPDAASERICQAAHTKADAKKADVDKPEPQVANAKKAEPKDAEPKK